MATKKRKVRREDGRPGELDQHHLLSKQEPEEEEEEEEEEDNQQDYEVSEQTLQQTVQIQPTHNPEDAFAEPGDEPNGDNADPDEDIAELLEPLSRDQLIALLRVAAGFDPRAKEEIRRAADRDPAHRKIFVHGLNWTTTADTLRSFFGQYGEIEECKIVTDRITGKSKGYGFILFRHRRTSRLALREPQKSIDGRMTACQLASVGPVAASSYQPPAPPPPSSLQAPVPYHTPQDVLPRKIFVGNVHADVSKERLFQFFSQYGEVEEGPLGFDRQTGKAKGFALFIYKTVEGARRALQDPNKNFDGKLLYCQKATDSQRAKAAVATTTTTAPSSTADGQGSVGYAVAPPGGPMGFPGAMDLGFAQGLLGAALPFAQGIQANPAALAMLAANPAAFGMPPSMMASLNPALAAAAMNPGGGQIVPPGQGPSVQGYGMGSGFQGVGYQGQPAQQSGGSYQNAAMAHNSGMRPAPGSMGGYGGPH
ncbi:uncharacterized protein LOC144704080 [Wolffia australiana]